MWRDRSLLGLVSAELVSLTGSAMTFVALPWFVLATTGSTARIVASSPRSTRMSPSRRFVSKASSTKRSCLSSK